MNIMTRFKALISGEGLSIDRKFVGADLPKVPHFVSGPGGGWAAENPQLMTEADLEEYCKMLGVDYESMKRRMGLTPDTDVSGHCTVLGSNCVADLHSETAVFVRHHFYERGQSDCGHLLTARPYVDTSWKKFQGRWGR